MYKRVKSVGMKKLNIQLLFRYLITIMRPYVEIGKFETLESTAYTPGVILVSSEFPLNTRIAPANLCIPDSLRRISSHVPE